MSAARAIAMIQEQVEQGTAATKCHGCGCFQQTVTALAITEAGQKELAPALARAKEVFVPKKYDCLGCAVCFPAVAANAFAEAFPGAGEIMDLCPTEAPIEREGWPPWPGDFKALRYGAPVAVCTLGSTELMAALAGAAADGLAIVGTMHTENLGIERLIQNVTSNPHVRFLILCGGDTEQAVGHLPGQSLESLFAHGVDDGGRIIGAKGKRPVLKNVSPGLVKIFRQQVELVSLVRETAAERVLDAVKACAARSPGSFAGAAPEVVIEKVPAVAPKRLVPDPAGYFVVYPDPRTKMISVEHFTNAGVLDVVVEGDTPSAIYATIIDRGIITRLDHAAYLGGELARASRALETGEPYVQDRAAGEAEDPEQVPSCGCATGCRS